VFISDLRHTLRQLRRTPIVTATAIATLALGVGATTAVFTLVQQVMLRTLPVAQPDQLWRIGDAVRCCHANGYAQGNWSFFSWDAYTLFRRNTPAFEHLAAFQVGDAELAVRRRGSASAIVTANGEYVSSNFFTTFGIAPWRGRLLTDDDDRDGAPPVAAMSFRAWQDQYGSDPTVVGETYQINGHAFTIVGVAPPGFFGAKLAAGTMPDFWLPLSMEPLVNGATARLRNTGEAWLDLIGRVRPGTNPRTLEAQLQLELQQWLASHAPDMTPQEKTRLDKQTLSLTPGGAGVSLLRETYQDGLRVLLFAAVCVLLVACANIASLLLVRGLKERPRTALRAALGASRARIVREALAESLVVSVFGAVAGIAVAYGGARLILGLAFTSPDTWAPVDAAPSTSVLLFALGIAAITALVFGSAPAWMAAHADPMEALATNRSIGGQLHWAQKTLVVVQAAVSLVLLSVATMLGQSLRNLEHQQFGFETGDRYLVSINAMLGNYKPEQLVPLVRDLEDRVRAISGVRMASAALYAPVSGLYWSHNLRIDGKPDPAPLDNVSSGWTRVTPGFIETVGNRIVMGRPITDADTATTRRVAVVNEAFARKFFGTEDPIGQHFGPAPRKNARTYEVVGVAADMRYFAESGNQVVPMYFVPEAQATHFEEPSLENREVWSHYPYSLVIWSPQPPRDLEAQVRKALAPFDVAIYGVQPYTDVIRANFSQQHMIASLAWLFGAVGLLLAAVGLYGVTAFGVERRTNEIGLRIALGADRGSVVALVMRGALWQVVVGLVLGLPAAIGAGYLIASQLFGVQPWNPLLLSGSALLLAIAASIAGLIPAWRGATVDPMQALRAD